jgi:hypothetical protein
MKVASVAKKRVDCSAEMMIARWAQSVVEHVAVQKAASTFESIVGSKVAEMPGKMVGLPADGKAVFMVALMAE